MSFGNLHAGFNFGFVARLFGARASWRLAPIGATVVVGKRADVSDRIFTVEEANALVPRLAELVGQQMTRASEIDALVRKLKLARGGRPAVDREGALDIAVNPSDDEATRAGKRELADRISAYEDGWRAVQELGAVVKDARTGLCDFYGHVEGKLVCLCWRYGESAVEFYHSLDAGFSSRKPLGKELRNRMLN